MLNKRIQPIDNENKTILAPGQRIDQNQLAKDLNTSLVPVREALKKLDSEGFVQIIPRRGAFVTETSIQDMEDLYFARGILEGEAGFHAAPRLTATQLKQLDRLHEQIGAALASHDFSEFNHLNRRFHFVIYEGAGSTYLLNMISGLWDLAERYRYRYVFFQDQAAVIQEEHAVILRACHAHDGPALRQAIVDHMTQTLNGIRSFAGQNPTKKE